MDRLLTDNLNDLVSVLAQRNVVVLWKCHLHDIYRLRKSCDVYPATQAQGIGLGWLSSGEGIRLSLQHAP